MLGRETDHFLRRLGEETVSEVGKELFPSHGMGEGSYVFCGVASDHFYVYEDHTLGGEVWVLKMLPD